MPFPRSPELEAWAMGFPLTLLHALVTMVILVVAAALYALITPHREIALIRQGNAAAAVSFGGALVGLAIPLAASLAATTSLRMSPCGGWPRCSCSWRCFA